MFILMGSYNNDKGNRDSVYLGVYRDKELAERARDAFHFLEEPGEYRASTIYSGYDLDSGWYEEFWSDWDWTMM